jgi:hypothetical protein
MVFMVVGCFFLMVFGFEIAWQEIMVSRLVNFSSRLFRTDQKLRGASKIKLKNVNKKRMATARRLIFLEK